MQAYRYILVAVAELNGLYRELHSRLYMLKNHEHGDVLNFWLSSRRERSRDSMVEEEEVATIHLLGSHTKILIILYKLTKLAQKIV